MKLQSLFVSGACVAALAFCAPLTASAKRKQSASPVPEASATPSASPTKERALPYHGMISEVDMTAKTFTIAGKEASRVFKITERTVIKKDGQPATMSDLVAKSEVRGAFWKNADGTMEAKSVKLGAKPPKKSKAMEATPSATP